MSKFKSQKKVIIILAIGAVLAYLMNMRTDITFSDALFVCGMMFFLVALMQIALNLGIFSGAGYGFKSFYRFFKNKNYVSKEKESGLSEYAASRPKYNDILILFLIGLGLLIMAVLL